MSEDLVDRLRIRASIRRNIQTRKSVQENQPDRISDLLEEAADEIERLNSLTIFAWLKSKIFNKVTKTECIIIK